MFSPISIKYSIGIRFFIQRFLSTTDSKSHRRPISSLLRFHMDTKSVFGPQRRVKQPRCTAPNEHDLFVENSKKRQFDDDTEALYAGPTGFRRACSISKGVSIVERRQYLRQLFRIPRGVPISLFPQAYVPDRELGGSWHKKKRNDTKPQKKNVVGS